MQWYGAGTTGGRAFAAEDDNPPTRKRTIFRGFALNSNWSHASNHHQDKMTSRPHFLRPPKMLCQEWDQKWVGSNPTPTHFWVSATLTHFRPTSVPYLVFGPRRGHRVRRRTSQLSPYPISARPVTSIRASETDKVRRHIHDFQTFPVKREGFGNHVVLAVVCLGWRILWTPYWD